ncbi:MAG: peptidase S24 [Bacteroidia bacterium]|jgi:SOS-response transcriptional repressor LexA|nr:peptidase S24 [Bacteroidia bacterium]
MKQNSTFFERIMQIAEYYGYKNANEFALNGLGYTSSQKIQRLKDENNKPSIDILLDISNKFESISIHWLLTGNGSMLNSDSYLVEEEATVYNKSSVMNVPIVSSYAYAGYLSGYSDPVFYEQLPTMPFSVDKEYKGRYVAFEVRGDSMNDGSINSYLPGDIVLGREVSKIHWQNKLHLNRWDFVIVHNTDGILIKKITQHNPVTGDIIAHSLNSQYDDIHMNLKDVWQLFNVVRVERNK